MKGTIIAAMSAAASLFAAATDAIALVSRENPRVVSMGIQRRQVEDPVARDRMRRLRRRGTVSQTLDNFQGGSLYFANVTLGTPPQNFRVHIDTGSSDLWMNSATSSFCLMSAQALTSAGNLPCSVSGTYDANKSSTYSYVDSRFLIKYADTTSARGDYATDTLRLGNVDVAKLQFGIGYVSNSSEGVMGIGYPALEVQAVGNGEPAYENIPQRMTQLGLIGTPAYSLWLDDLAAAAGQVLFGGVDTNKFTGSLVSLPILQEQKMYIEMVVQLDTVSLLSGGRNTTLVATAVPVLLDSGSTLSYLPSSVVQSIYSAVGARYDESQGAATVPCSVANSNTVIDFVFSGKVISVPMSEMVLQLGSACVFGISPQHGAPYTLGDTFIRSAYLVYDLGRNTISLAQTNFDSDPSRQNIQEIRAGTNGVLPVGATATAGTPAGTATASASSSAGAGPVPTAHVAAWAGVAGVGVLLAAAL